MNNALENDHSSGIVRRSLVDGRFQAGSEVQPFDYHRTSFGESETNNRDLDSERSREFMKMIYLLSEVGGKWRPDESDFETSSVHTTSLKGWNTFRPNGKRKADVCSTSAFFVLSRYLATTCVNDRRGVFSVVSDI